MGFNSGLPTFQSDMLTQQIKWQILTPNRWHLLSGPSGMSLEANWQWQDTFWHRIPTLSQQQLEEWSGGLEEKLPPSMAVHSYLFTGLAGFNRSRRCLFLARLYYGLERSLALRSAGSFASEADSASVEHFNLSAYYCFCLERHSPIRFYWLLKWGARDSVDCLGGDDSTYV